MNETPTSVQITQGLLDALVLTPLVAPEGLKLLQVKIQGLPGFHATLEIAAVQELRQALDVILGPQATPDLAVLLRKYFSVYDRPCDLKGGMEPHCRVQ